MKAFIDTNVLVYMYDARDKYKQKRARTLVENLTADGSATISTQVVREFYNIVLYKLKIMPASALQPIVDSILWPKVAGIPELRLYEEGAKLCERYSLSFYDALIVQAALDLECDVLYSEDLQHEQKFGRLEVVNPFKR